jgi:hypothetical protein
MIIIFNNNILDNDKGERAWLKAWDEITSLA